MKEAVIATLVFWSTFVFTVGAFWIATMEAAVHTSFKEIYKNYFVYLLVGWLPEIATIGLIVGLVGQFSPQLLTWLYFIGGGVIFYLAYRTVVSKASGNIKFEFNWKAMTLLSWTNPKVWLSIPAGFLAATYTDNLAINIALFYLLGLPLFVPGVYVWGMIGRQGAKIAKGKLSYFNAALLCGFAIYLLYQGILLAAEK